MYFNACILPRSNSVFLTSTEKLIPTTVRERLFYAIGNSRVAEAAARVSGDAATLASANIYTDEEVAAEAALRATADTAIGVRIAADDALRDQIASSTATALALGCNAILPDANFTLAGKMGFYNGATAVSINTAGKVGSSVYVTAAVGGGLNKQGKVGGRVGVVFGF